MGDEYLSQSEFCFDKSRKAASETETAAWLELAAIWLKMYSAVSADADNLCREEFPRSAVADNSGEAII